MCRIRRDTVNERAVRILLECIIIIIIIIISIISIIIIIIIYLFINN